MLLDEAKCVSLPLLPPVPLSLWARLRASGQLRELGSLKSPDIIPASATALLCGLGHVTSLQLSVMWGCVLVGYTRTSPGRLFLTIIMQLAADWALLDALEALWYPWRSRRGAGSTSRIANSEQKCAEKCV